MRTFRKLCIWMQIILRFRNVILTRAREQSYHRKQKPSYSPATDQMPAENFMQWCTNVRCRMHEISSHRKSIWACVTGSMINVFHDQSASHRQTRWTKRVFIRNRFVGWSVVNVEHICGIKNIIFFLVVVVEFFSLFRNLTKWRIVKLHDLFHNSMKQVLLHLSSACIDFGWESERASVYCFVNRCSAIAWYSLTIILHQGSHLFYNSHTACLAAKTNLSKGKQSKAMQR